MSAIGTLVFCTDCGNLLPPTKANPKNRIKCDCCGVMNKDTGAELAVSYSKPSDFPSFLRQKLQSKVQAVQRHTIQSGTAASETCPKCGGSEVTYTAVQLRSADEGSTIIYTCACGNSWHENN